MHVYTCVRYEVSMMKTGQKLSLQTMTPMITTKTHDGKFVIA